MLFFFFFYKICEVGGLVIIQKRTSNQIWLHLKEEIRKILRTWLYFGGMLEPMIFQLFLDIYLVPFFPRKSFI